MDYESSIWKYNCGEGNTCTCTQHTSYVRSRKWRRQPRPDKSHLQLANSPHTCTSGTHLTTTPELQTSTTHTKNEVQMVSYTVVFHYMYISTYTHTCCAYIPVSPITRILFPLHSFILSPTQWCAHQSAIQVHIHVYMYRCDTSA